MIIGEFWNFSFQLSNLHYCPNYTVPKRIPKSIPKRIRIRIHKRNNLQNLLKNIFAPSILNLHLEFEILFELVCLKVKTRKVMRVLIVAEWEYIFMKTDTVHFEKALPLTLPRVLHSNGQIS